MNLRQGRPQAAPLAHHLDKLVRFDYMHNYTRYKTVPNLVSITSRTLGTLCRGAGGWRGSAAVKVVPREPPPWPPA